MIKLKNKPRQVEEEWEIFVKSISDIKFNYVLEIGAGYGGSAETFSYLANHLISIDSGEPRFDILDINSRCKYKYLVGDSHMDETREAVEQILGSEQLDMLFIDGDHSLAGAKLDYFLYKGLVKQNGIIVLHDIVRSTTHENSNCRVDILWKEIRDSGKYKCVDIITDGTWGGIGIIQNKTEEPEWIRRVVSQLG